MNRKQFNLNNWLRQFLMGAFYNRKNSWQAFPAFFDAVSEPSYPIPGLKKARSLNLTHEIDACLAMTPQGMTLTEKYLLISAYCHDHQHHSVIYVLDRNTGRRIKTVVLPDLPHAGGLAYDLIHQKVWISNTAGENAAVTAIRLQDIENYSDASKPIVYQQKVALKALPRASAITYDEGYLYVALFTLKEQGKFCCYPIDSEGNLENAKNLLDFTGKREHALLASPFDTLRIPPKIQGVTIYKDLLLLSQSWGKQPGNIVIFDIQQTSDFSDLQQALKIIETPPYLEQIYVEDDQLFALFESGASAYRKKTAFVTRDVLQIDVPKLFNS